MTWRRSSAGVGEQGTCTKGSPRTWEVRTPPRGALQEGTWVTQYPGPESLRFAAPGERRRSAAGVPPSDGNEARGEGRSGVGAVHITWEAGNRPHESR